MLIKQLHKIVHRGRTCEGDGIRRGRKELFEFSPGIVGLRRFVGFDHFYLRAALLERARQNVAGDFRAGYQKLLAENINALDAFNQTLRAVLFWKEISANASGGQFTRGPGSDRADLQSFQVTHIASARMKATQKFLDPVGRREDQIIELFYPLDRFVEGRP